MASGFTEIDLSRLAPPDIIEALSYETILAEMLADFTAKWPDYDVGALETDPAKMVLEVAAYREVLLRNRVNFAARAVMVAYAGGHDLEHLGAFFGVARMDGESDDRFRRRVQLAPEAYSMGGPRGAFIYWALTLSTEIADAWAFCPADGVVRIVVAGAAGEPVSDDCIAELVRFYDQEDVRPLTDEIAVQKAELVPFDVSLTGVLARGPSPATVKAEIEAAIRTYCTGRYRIGQEVRRNGIIAAAMVRSVDDVTNVLPAGDVICGDTQIAVLRDLTVTMQVV